MALDAVNITATVETEPDIIASMSNATYRGSFSYLTPEEKQLLKGDKGDKGDPGEKGDSGVYIGDDEPIDDKMDIWIDTDEETIDYETYIQQQINEKMENIESLTNTEIEMLIGGTI